MKDHICRQIRYCSCYSLALEPSEDCMIHGIHKQSRCSYCGRFLKNSIEVDVLNIAAKHGYFGSITKNGAWLIIKLFDNSEKFKGIKSS